MWPGLAGTGTGSAGRRPGLGLEVPAEGRDWIALGLGSAVQGAGLGLERSGDKLDSSPRSGTGCALGRDFVAGAADERRGVAQGPGE